MVRNKLLTLSLCALVVCVFSIEMLGMYRLNPYACEDAYITFRVARNLAGGDGPVFNAGERVEAYSNFLWMVTIAGAHALGLPMQAFSQVAGVLLNGLCLLLVWYIPWRWFGCRGSAALLGPLLYLLFVPFHFYAFAGLETTLYTLLMLLALLACLWAGADARRFMLAGLVFLLLALTRPEGLVFFLFFGAWRAWRAWAHHEPLKPYVPGAALFMLGLGIFILWRLAYFGLPLPNTYYAKGSMPFAFRAALGFITNKGFAANYFFLLLYPLALLALLRIPTARSPAALIGVFAAAGAFFAVGFSGFDWMPYFRYTLPIAPLLIILCQIVLSRCLHDLRRSYLLRRALVIGGLTAGLIVCAAEQCARDLAFNVRWKELSDFAYHNQKTFADWYRREVHPDAVLAVGDVGRLAFFSEARILDIFGLASAEFAGIKHAYGSPDLARFGTSITFDTYKDKERELLLRMAPDYVLLYTACLKISDTYPGSRIGIADHVDFQDRYDYLATFYIIPPFAHPSWPRLRHCVDVLDLSAGLLAWIQDGWGYDIYIRKNSPHTRFTIDTTPAALIRSISAQHDENTRAQRVRPEAGNDTPWTAPH